MTTLAFVDLETTGLDPTSDELWEVAILVRGHLMPEWDGLWSWVIRPKRLKLASPDALGVGRYYLRGHLPLDRATEELKSRPLAELDVDDVRSFEGESGVEALLSAVPPGPMNPRPGPTSRQVAAMWMAALLEDAVLIGNNVAFDARFLRNYLFATGHVSTWQYRVVDVVALAAGWKRLPLPWRSEEVSRLCGVEPPAGLTRHTAVHNALWAMRLFDAVLAPPPEVEAAPEAAPVGTGPVPA